MPHFFSRLLLFLGILVGLKGAAWWLYQDDLRRFVWSSSYKSAQLDSLRPACNAVFIGSSRTFMSIIPGRFDSLTGQPLRSYNYGVAELFAPHSFRLTESLLSRPNSALRYVFLELSLPSSNMPQEPFWFNPLAELSYRARLWRLTKDLTGEKPWNRWTDNYALAALSPSVCLHRSVSSLLKRMSVRAKLIKPIAFPYEFVASPDGYLRDKRLHPAPQRSDTTLLPMLYRLAKQTFFAQPAQNPGDAYWADVAALLQLAEARHVHLMVYLPNRPSVAEARWLPAVFNRIPPANRLQLRADGRFDALFQPTYSFDRGHLNHHGAQQYTTLMAEAFRRATGPVVVAQRQSKAR